MKLIIDIPEEEYRKLMKKLPAYPKGEFCLSCAIQHGKPLSEIIEATKTEIETEASWSCFDDWGNETAEWSAIKEILDRHISGKEKE